MALSESAFGLEPEPPEPPEPPDCVPTLMVTLSGCPFKSPPGGGGGGRGGNGGGLSTIVTSSGMPV